MTAVEIGGIAPGPQEWEALADAVGASPFVRPGWVQTWHRAFGRGQELTLTARRNGELVGVLPLVVRRRVLESPTNWHTPEYAPVASDGEVAAMLLAGAVRLHQQRLQLSFVDSHTAQSVARLATAHGQHVLTRQLERAPYLDVSGTFADYEQRLGRHLRTEIRRRRRRLDEVGPVTLDVVGKDHEEAFAEFCRVEASGWKGEKGTAVGAQQQTRSFYADLADCAADRGWLRLALLRVGDRAVAGDLALECDGVHYLLKTGFDPVYGRFAPGKILRHAMIERAYSERLTSYEFLGQDADWKLEWTSSARPRYVVQAFARTMAGRVDHVAQEYGKPAMKAVLARSRHWRGR